MTGFRISGITGLSFLTLEELISRIEDSIKRNKFLHIVILDLRLFVKSFFNKSLREVLEEADIVLPIGRFFSWGMRKLFFSEKQLKFMSSSLSFGGATLDLRKVRERLSVEQRDFSNDERVHLSIVLIQRLLHEISGFFFIGGTGQDLSFAYKYIKQSFPFVRILGIHSRLQLGENPDAVLEKIKKVEPSVLIVDLGRGRQERWIRDNKVFFGKSVCIGLNNELSFLAGREEEPGFFSKETLLFPFLAFYYLAFICLYKTFFRRELEWIE